MTIHVISFKKASMEDLNGVMDVFESARELLKADGSPQWQNGHPNQADFVRDIKNGHTYVLIVDDVVAATACLIPGPDADYATIYEGRWQNPELKYAAIHRVAVSANYRGKGLSRKLFTNLFKVTQELGFEEIRVDTHKKNLRMQSLLESFGFIRSGVIYIAADPVDKERFVFEKTLEL